MAQLNVNSVSALISDLASAADQFPELREQMLTAQADLVEPAVRSAVVAAGLRDTGTLQASIGRVKKEQGSKILIGPSGVHHRYVRRTGSGEVRSGHVGYIHEYGAPARGIRAKKWMSGAVQNVSGKALDAAEAVYDEYMKKHNL